MAKKGKQFQRTEDGHLLLMSNEERNLLITDLTARLNYGVICLIERVDDFGPIHRDEKLTGFSFDDRGGFYFEVCGGLSIDFAEKIMPYLRPMSSMTKEEKKERLSTFFTVVDTKMGLTPMLSGLKSIEYIDWLNAHHFDYRSLIEKGLALAAPEGMYNIE